MAKKSLLDIPLLFLSFDGARYGAGGCDVSVGSETLPAIAVTCERFGKVEKFITGEQGAQQWLQERGLPVMVAWGLVNETRNGVNHPAEPKRGAEFEALPLWQRLNALSHRFGYDSPEARACSEAADIVRGKS